MRSAKCGFVFPRDPRGSNSLTTLPRRRLHPPPPPAAKSMDRSMALDGFSYAKMMQERRPMRESVLTPEAVKELADLAAKAPPPRPS